MKLKTLLLTLLITTSFIGSNYADSKDSFKEWELRAMQGNAESLSQNVREKVLLSILRLSGKDCVGVTRVFMQGHDKDGATYWNISCSSGQSYGVQIPTKLSENTRILECSIMRVLDIKCFEKF